jgi:hypothetical protein
MNNPMKHVHVVMCLAVHEFIYEYTMYMSALEHAGMRTSEFTCIALAPVVLADVHVLTCTCAAGFNASDNGGALGQ